jgi:hypothetical protein
LEGKIMGKIINYAFWLSLILILVVYYTGVKSDATVFGTYINKILLTLTGRTKDGQFANYPDGSK